MTLSSHNKGDEEFCAIATMSDIDIHRQKEREITLGSTFTHRETTR
jgi:hypothetical protein